MEIRLPKVLCKNRTAGSRSLSYTQLLNPFEATGHIGIDGTLTRLTVEGLLDVYKRQRLEGADGDLLLGGDHTNKVRLMANLADVDGEHVLLSNYGAAYFPDSLRVRHNYGGDLLSTYRNDSEDEGILIHKRLRFGTDDGCYLAADAERLTFVSRSDRTAIPDGGYSQVAAFWEHAPSTSLYRCV